MNNTERIAALLYNARAKAGCSQENIAEMLDISKQTVRNWEKGTSTPNLNEFVMWYRVLGMNCFRDIMRLIHPELYEDFEGSHPDVEQRRNGLFKYLADCPPGEVDKLAFLIFGAHGSDWPSMLDEYVANAHCSMHSRAAVCGLILDNYTLEAGTGELVEPETAPPCLKNLKSAYAAGKSAAHLGRNEYAR